MSHHIERAKRPHGLSVQAGRAAHGRVPQVTFGLPVYNGEAYLRKTLDSVLSQTYVDFELVIADNASTDKTVEIVQSYAAQDGRITLVQSDRNRGATYNYNRVLDMASGEYFKWIAADDVIHPAFLSAAVDVLDHQPKVALVYSKAAFIDADDYVLYHFDDVMQLPSWPAEAPGRTQQMLRAIFTDGSAANVMVFGLVRTAVMRSIRPLGNYFGCDFAIVTDLALAGQVYEIPAVLSFYRRHADSSSTYKRPSADSQQRFLDPAISGRLRQELQLRRRYFEVFHGIARAKLSIQERASIAAGGVAVVAQRAAWRVRYEIAQAFGDRVDAGGDAAQTAVRRHWQAYAGPARSGE